jgi:hypothetical protein
MRIGKELRGREFRHGAGGDADRIGAGGTREKEERGRLARWVDEDFDWQTRERIARRYGSVKSLAGNRGNFGLDGRGGRMNGVGRRKRKNAPPFAKPSDAKGRPPQCSRRLRLGHPPKASCGFKGRPFAEIINWAHAAHRCRTRDGQDGCGEIS